MIKAQKSSRKYLIYFMAAFITFYLTQETLLNRLILIDGGYITGGTFIYFLSPLLTDVVAEVYGYRAARQMLWCGLFAMLFFAISVAITLRLPYPVLWKNVANSYDVALRSTSRGVIVGDVAIMVGQLVNAYLISKWRILVKGKYFWLRSVGSSIIGDTLTVGISILGIFAGRMPVDSIFKTLVPELCIMVVFSAAGAFLAWGLTRIVARLENINLYAPETSFNPFKMDSVN